MTHSVQERNNHRPLINNTSQGAGAEQLEADKNQSQTVHCFNSKIVADLTTRTVRMHTHCVLLGLAYILINRANRIHAGIFEDHDGTCISSRLMKRYALNEHIYSPCTRDNSTQPDRLPRRVDPTFRGHPKAHSEILATKFNMELRSGEQSNSLINLVNKVASEYLSECPPVIYYDSFVKKSDDLILQNLFKTFPMTFYHGEINKRQKSNNPHFQQRIDNNCKSYILFLSDPLMTRQIIGAQTDSRVVLIARSTQWRLRDFLASEKSSNIVNLLVIGESLTTDPTRERPYVLYTHKLYTDGLGSNTPVVLTSWINGALSRPHVRLFPPKFQEGFAGHRFQVAAANQPPYIFRIHSLGMGGSSNVRWEGVEYRLMDMISKKLNFSMEISEAPDRKLNSIVDTIQYEVAGKNVDIGMAGVYVTAERLGGQTDMSAGHSMDCAAFITLASKALPKYRAIMGPFQWPVWVALTFVYLGGIFPIAFTDRLTLSHLIGNWGEIENMFWYVFGMFTNSLTFSGRYSWSSSQKVSTRLLIGSYWSFTIIITACYTGSIIAFVTLPAFPDTVDSVLDLLGLFFRVGTLGNSGWETWFQNSTHPATSKLYKKMEFVSTLEEGIGNVTQSFFWNYAFLGSKSQLEYLVQSNFSEEVISRRSVLHLSEECFGLFQVGYFFPKESVFKRKIDSMIQLAQQSGLMAKISNDVKWTMQRSATGKLLQASSSNALRERIQEERQLTTADTEGMFLLMGVGYLLGAIALLSEIVGGISNKCRQIVRRSRKLSTAWSTKSNSMDEGTERADTAHLAHKRRRIAAEEEAKRNQGFGMREFNLTKTTLKELYGNYYKAEPNYIIRDGRLLLETDSVSVDSSEYNSRNSSAEQQRHPAPPPLRTKTRTIVLAEVDVSHAHDVSVQDVNASLARFDQCLEAHTYGDIAEETANEMIMESMQDQCLFGSDVEPERPTSKMDTLNLFQSDEELADLAKSMDKMKK